MKLYDEANTGAVLRARQLRRDSTEAEKRLWRALRSKLPQHKWRRQMPVGPYFADLACFAEKLVIEIDGGQHSEAGAYDERRTRFIRSRGFRLLRFWNNDVMSNTDGVLDTIAQILSRRDRDRDGSHRKDEMEGTSSSPSQPAAGPLPLPMGEV